MSGPVERPLGADAGTAGLPSSPARRRGSDLVVARELSLHDRKIAHHTAVVDSLEPVAAQMLASGKYFLPLSKLWQPADLLPDLETEGWQDRLAELRKEAKGVSPELFVVLVGDTVTEEALPTYQTWLNRIAAIRDETGTDQGAFARGGRLWTAEENRHGDLLNTWLLLSGRINMRAMQQSTYSLLANGFDPGVGEDPYNFFVYTSFQERATNISHKRAGRRALEEGAPGLARINGTIASDEKRHENWYTDLMGEIMKRDPEGGVIAFADMLKTGVVMPAALMTDGELLAPSSAKKQSDLFTQFSDVAQQIKVYTAADYLDIIKHLYKTWGIRDLNLSGEAAKAQADIARRIAVYTKTLDRALSQPHTVNANDFAWIQPRS